MEDLGMITTIILTITRILEKLAWIEEISTIHTTTVALEVPAWLTIVTATATLDVPGWVAIVMVEMIAHFMVSIGAPGHRHESLPSSLREIRFASAPMNPPEDNRNEFRTSTGMDVAEQSNKCNIPCIKINRYNILLKRRDSIFHYCYAT